MSYRPTTKKGQHGTLYLYDIRYQDGMSPIFSWRAWAYNEEHAEEKFWDSGDEGWEIRSIKRVPDKNKPMRKKPKRKKNPASVRSLVAKALK